MPPGGDGADAVVTRPTTAMLVDRRSQADVARQAEQLRDALEPWSQPVSQGASAAPARSAGAPGIGARPGTPAPSGDQRASARPGHARRRAEPRPRIRGRELRPGGDVHGARRCRRRHRSARTSRRGGARRRRVPRAAGFARRVRLVPRRDRERRGSHGARRRTKGTDASGPCWGAARPREAYVAPIESGGHVAALLYADNLPGARRSGTRPCSRSCCTRPAWCSTARSWSAPWRRPSAAH